MESRIQDCLGFPYMMSPTDKDPFNLHQLFFNNMIFSIKITEVIKPDGVKNVSRGLYSASISR